MYRRNVSDRLRAALRDTRVVLLNGARQAGKSTLVRQWAEDVGARYLTLDDEAVLAAARADPTSFVRGAGLMIVDEVQKAPDLFSAIKLEVDRDPRPGRFLLTGSANVFLLPRLSDSLAGRLEILPLWPLSQDEIAGRLVGFPDSLFAETNWKRVRCSIDRIDVCRRIVTGGFPEAVARPDSDRRSAWFRSYVSSVLQRDVRDLANVEGLVDLPRLLALLAARTSALANASELSRATTIPHSTLRRYLTLLEATFLLQPLPPWSSNLGKRVVKSSKLHLVDSGLTAHLRGETDPETLAQSPDLGPLLESFVLQEIRKQLAWSRVDATAHHFRTATGKEVDVVLEAAGGRVVGIEVKAAAAIGRRDFAGLEALAEIAGRKFVRGVVLHLGEHAVPFGERFWALPVGVLWGEGS
jgi:uncharacterized protein